MAYDDVKVSMVVTWADGTKTDPVEVPFPTILGEIRQARTEVGKEVRTMRGVTFTLEVGNP